MEERTRVNWMIEREDEEAMREQDRRFQKALFDAYQRGEFPGQSFRLIP
jgi:hypothetical protein